MDRIDALGRRRVLYLPIETKARELNGKTLLAARAAERGWQVILGQQEAVREAVSFGPPGVFVEMSIPSTKAQRLARYRERGHRIANICEESVVYYDALDYCRRKVGPESVEQVDVMLVAGAANEADLRKHRPTTASKIALTGNARFDTLSPAARCIYAPAAEKLRERFGRFLLVNTNFMRTNHFKRRPEQLIERMRSENAIVDDEHADLVRRQYAYKGEQMEKLKPVLVAIAAAKVFDRIVLRPHPSENHETWRAWAGDHGIDVVYEGSANEWILAADAFLHTGCTTGIESVLLDVPVASYQPIRGHDLLNQADAVSEPFTSADEFLALAETWRAVPVESRRQRLETQRERLVPLIANAEPPRAVDRIVDAIDRLDVSGVVPEKVTRNSANPAQRAVQFFRGRFKGIFGAYHRQKFPSLDDDDLAGPISAWLSAGVLERMPDRTRLPDGTWLLR